MSKNMKRKGVTLIELLIVVLILAALAVIAIPRVSQSATNAKTNACATNVDLINSAIEMFYADSTPNAYPTLLTEVIGTVAAPNTTYFPDGPPTCPLGGAYSMGANHRVTCSH